MLKILTTVFKNPDPDEVHTLGLDEKQKEKFKTQV